jgi:FMN phosphatase YigB (HAD superfamily)
MNIAFDIGNVLCNLYLDKFTKEFNKTCSAPLYSGEDFIKDIQGLQDLGLTTLGQRLREYGAPYSSHKRLIKAWNSIVVPNKRMIEFKDELLEAGFSIALLSNMGITHRDYLLENNPKLFHGCIKHLSCDIGSRKPMKLYYQSFLLQHSGFYGRYFIDDNSDNLKVAREVGFRTYQFDLSTIIEENLESEIDNLRQNIFRRFV